MRVPDAGLAGWPGLARTHPEPPVTADHTPERLNADIERALWAHRYRDEWDPTSLPGQIIAREAQVVVRALAAHLADVEARLAAAEALADHWDEWLPVSLMASGRRVLDDIDVRDLTSELRAALHPPCTSKLMLRWGSDMCDNPEPRHTEHSHSGSDHTWTDVEAEQSIKDRENL